MRSQFDMDRILVEGLQVETCIGVYDWERTIKQRLVFDLEIHTDIKASAASDNLSLTVDYKMLSDRLIEYVSGTSFELLEALAENLAELLIQEFGITHLILKVSKPDAVPQAKNIALVIERGLPCN